jgi:hypothetical protein
MAPQVTASDVQGALSEGSGSNYAFDSRLVGGVTGVFVGDIAAVTIAPPSGLQHANYIIPGIDSAQMSLSAGSGYGATGAALTVGVFSSPRTIYVKVAAAVNPAPKLVLPSDGFTAMTGTPSISGTVASTSGVSGSAVVVRVISGSVLSESGVTGSMTKYSETPSVSGSVDSVSGVIGNVLRVVIVSGSVASSSGISGTAARVKPVAGSIASVSAVAGNVTKAAGASTILPVLYFPEAGASVMRTTPGSAVDFVEGNNPEYPSLYLEVRVEDSAGAVLNDWSIIWDVLVKPVSVLQSNTLNFTGYAGTTGIRFKLRLRTTTTSAVICETPYFTFAGGPLESDWLTVTVRCWNETSDEGFPGAGISWGNDTGGVRPT